MILGPEAQFDVAEEIRTSFTHGWTPNEYRMLKHQAEAKHIDFTKTFFKEREASTFIESAHHKVLCDTLDKVLNLEITRLVVTIPPGYTKTEIATLNFIARGLALNPRAKFIHTSYSDSLVNLNSSKVKEIVFGEQYNMFWPMTLRKDMQGKKEWYNNHGGGLYVAPSGGAITGFRAGRMEPGFTGAFIADDLLNPDDAFSDPVKKKMRNRITSVYMSRLAHMGIPIVLIMQRVAEDDPAAFVLNGGTGEVWHHLDLPVLIDSKATKQEYSHGMPVEHNLPDGPLWEDKHDEEQIDALRKDKFTFAAQYMQQPLSLGGNLVDLTKCSRYARPPTRTSNCKVSLSFDTANKDNDLNDPSVCEVWLKDIHNRKYLLDIWKDQVKYPALKKTAVDLINKWKPNEILIEDKASGQQLIQELQLTTQGVVPVETGTASKIMRMANETSALETGEIWLPESAPWLYDFEQEAKLFPNGTKDQVDALSQYLKCQRTSYEVYVG